MPTSTLVLVKNKTINCAYVIFDLSWWKIQYSKKSLCCFRDPKKSLLAKKILRTPPSLKYVSGAPGDEVSVENSPNPLSVYIRLCKHRKKVFYYFYKITLPRKNASSLLRSWLKEKFLPVAKSYTRSLALVVSSCFAKRCFPKYGFFSLKMSA